MLPPSCMSLISVQNTLRQCSHTMSMLVRARVDRFLKVCFYRRSAALYRSEIEVSSQEQLQTTPLPTSATTTANSDGVDVRQKQTTLEATKRTQQKNKICPDRSVLGVRKTANARLKKKALTARLPASQRGSYILLESGRLRAMIPHHDTLRELFQLEKSKISTKV